MRSLVEGAPRRLPGSSNSILKSNVDYGSAIIGGKVLIPRLS